MFFFRRQRQPYDHGRHPMDTLEDKVAVITGAGSGIGRAIALELAASGAHVVAADIRPDAATRVAGELHALGVRALPMATDVADPAAVAALADRAFEAFGRVDILVNNAGVTWRPFRSVFDASLADWEFILAANLRGVIHGLHAFLPRMKRQPGRKHIVNTASILSHVPLAGHMPYSASKAAVASLSESLAEELAPHGFGVTILCPGFVHTQVTQNSQQLRDAAGLPPTPPFEPYENPLTQRLAADIIEAPEVGVMVRNAILDDALYVHTRAIPPDLLETLHQRRFGPQTLGRAGGRARREP